MVVYYDIGSVGICYGCWSELIVLSLIWEKKVGMSNDDAAMCNWAYVGLMLADLLAEVIMLPTTAYIYSRAGWLRSPPQSLYDLPCTQCEIET